MIKSTSKCESDISENEWESEIVWECIWLQVKKSLMYDHCLSLKYNNT